MQANFHELSKETVAESLSTHNAREGVMVRIFRFEGQIK